MTVHRFELKFLSRRSWIQTHRHSRRERLDSIVVQSGDFWRQQKSLALAPVWKSSGLEEVTLKTSTRSLSLPISRWGTSLYVQLKFVCWKTRVFDLLQGSQTGSHSLSWFYVFQSEKCIWQIDSCAEEIGHWRKKHHLVVWANDALMFRNHDLPRKYNLKKTWINFLTAAQTQYRSKAIIAMSFFLL